MLDGELLASPGSAAANDVDLLTVLEHELGHVLGLPDNAQDGDLMDITLGLGIRRAQHCGPGGDRIVDDRHRGRRAAPPNIPVERASNGSHGGRGLGIDRRAG